MNILIKLYINNLLIINIVFTKFYEKIHFAASTTLCYNRVIYISRNKSSILGDENDIFDKLIYILVIVDDQVVFKSVP